MQVRSCLRHGRQEEEQPEVPSSSRKSPSGVCTALKLQLHSKALLHQPAGPNLPCEVLLHQTAGPSLHCACVGPQTARGRRAVGDGGFAGMRLSQVMPALPPLQPRRHTDTNLHLSQSERRSSGAFVLCMPFSLRAKPFLNLSTLCKA